jgi:hypothetical protein
MHHPGRRPPLEADAISSNPPSPRTHQRHGQHILPNQPSPSGAALSALPHTLRRELIVNSTRKTSIATGTLFILATAAALTAAALEPALTGTDYPTGVADHPNRLAAAGLLYLIAAGASVGHRHRASRPSTYCLESRYRNGKGES